MSERKFKVGDVCRIREWDDMAKEFGIDENGTIQCEASFTFGMKYMCGETFTIKEILWTMYVSEENIEDAYTISGDMLELIEDESAIPPITTEDFNAILNL